MSFLDVTLCFTVDSFRLYPFTLRPMAGNANEAPEPKKKLKRLSGQLIPF